MKRLLFSLLAASSPIVGWSQSYEPVDAASTILFKIKNFGVSTDGSFTGLKGTIQFDPNELSTSRFDVTINAFSINTGIDYRDKHLKKEEYFDVNNFKEIRFRSDKIEATANPGKFIITGKLTIKKTTREIKFNFTAQKKGNGYLFNGELPLNRRDYGVGGNSFSLSDELKVFLSVNADENQR